MHKNRYYTDRTAMTVQYSVIAADASHGCNG